MIIIIFKLCIVEMSIEFFKWLFSTEAMTLSCLRDSFIFSNSKLNFVAESYVVRLMTLLKYYIVGLMGFSGSLVVKSLPASAGDAGDRVWPLDWEGLSEKEMTTHSSILAWKVPWTEEPGRLYSIWSYIIGQDWACLYNSVDSFLFAVFEICFRAIN